VTDRVPAAQGPAALTGLRLTEPKEVAAGVQAVAQAMKYATDWAGVVKGPRLLTLVNQHDGFDCPSCAWPDPKGHRATAEFCENGAKAVADAADRRRADAAFFASHSVAELASWPDKALNDAGRLTNPMVLREGSSHYEAVGWDEAIGVVATHLRCLTDPDQAVFYTSGRTSNEAAFLYQLFVRAFGTNNLPDCSNMCHESSGAALNATIGIGKGTVLLEDFDLADAVIVVGQNPGTNHPRMLTALQGAKERGATIVGINPLPETGLIGFNNPQDWKRPTKVGKVLLDRDKHLADLLVPVRVAGDLALLSGVQKELLEREADRPGSVVDAAFVAADTVGFEVLRDHLATLDWDVLEQESGIDRDGLRQLADIIADNERVIWCWAMGLTQHEHAVGTIQQIVNLALLRGSIGKPGAGLCPVRGHSNVQGDRTVGIWEQPPDWLLEGIERELGITAPTRHGHDTVAAIRAMASGEARVFVGMGGNFLSAAPDTEATAEALRRTDLTVAVSTKLNRSHLVTGRTAIILPCLTRTERDRQLTGDQFVSVENSMGIVHASRGRARPASNLLRSEPAIVAALATAVLGDRVAVDWQGLVDDYDRVRDLIQRIVPGFDEYNTRVRTDDGFALPNGPRDGNFTTPDAKAHFTTYDVPRSALHPDELLLMTVRSHDQFNTTIYGLDDRYRGVHNERRVVFCNPDDLAGRGLSTGDVVDLVGTHDGVVRVAERFVCIAFDIPAQCAAAYFPETNVLVPLDRVARGSNTPVSKAIPIRLRATGEHVAT